MFLSRMGYSLHSGPTPRGRLESEDRVSTAHPGSAANVASRTRSDLIIILELCELLLVHNERVSTLVLAKSQVANIARVNLPSQFNERCFRGKSGIRTSFLPGKQFSSSICSSSSGCCTALPLLLIVFPNKLESTRTLRQTLSRARQSCTVRKQRIALS